MFFGELNNPARAQQATDEGPKRRPDNLAGALAQPAIDRAKLEDALEYYRTYNNGPHTSILMDAARAHLATLPKFVWHVNASKYRPEGTTALPPFATEDREKAAIAAVSFLKQGYTNVGVRLVRS